MNGTAQLVNELQKLRNLLKASLVPADLEEECLLLIDRLGQVATSGEYTSEYGKVAYYIDWVINLPWSKRSDDILDLEHAKKVLDKSHYGLEQIKERILEYLAVLALKRGSSGPTAEAAGPMKFMRAPILCFIGLVGTGKTTIAYSIAEAMGRKFVRIPFGGMGDPLDLRGQSRVRPDAEPGLVIKALKRAGTKNPVLLLDELDRVTDEGRASIMGVLVELLDPEQNFAFRDHFIDYPFDLSEVLFIATGNNTTSIATAVLDRLEPMQMPSYSDEEKITIGRNYVLPKTMEEAGLKPNNLVIDEAVWPKIVRPLGYDAGVRTLERTINGICRKVARLIVERKGESFRVTPENVKDFLPSW